MSDLGDFVDWIKNLGSERRGTEQEPNTTQPPVADADACPDSVRKRERHPIEVNRHRE